MTYNKYLRITIVNKQTTVLHSWSQDISLLFKLAEVIQIF